jgi:hypothetical protein
MTVNTAKPSVFEAGLPTLRYDVTERAGQLQHRRPLTITARADAKVP